MNVIDLNAAQSGQSSFARNNHKGLLDGQSFRFVEELCCGLSYLKIKRQIKIQSVLRQYVVLGCKSRIAKQLQRSCPTEATTILMGDSKVSGD